jgi:hypothetical protein
MASSGAASNIRRGSKDAGSIDLRAVANLNAALAAALPDLPPPVAKKEPEPSPAAKSEAPAGENSSGPDSAVVNGVTYHRDGTNGPLLAQHWQRFEDADDVWYVHAVSGESSWVPVFKSP